MSLDLAALQQQTQLNEHTTPTLYYSPTIDSTNTAAKRRVAAGQKPPFFIVASQQTAGKGRLNRAFYSPADTGIYLTYTFVGDLATLNPGLLTTSVAVIAAQAITKMFHVKPQIKWVNDLYLRDKKITGILCETTPINAQQVAVIVGMGINLKTPNNLAPDLAAKVGGIDAPGDVVALVADLLQALPKLAETYATGDYLPYYHQHAYLQGKTVILQTGATKVKGEVAGIAPNGGLELQTPQGLKTFDSGEVTRVLFDF
ncbi:biotin operon repressor [Agrilactobacillus composti DSM 18527 = JCM 14202]|uniref:biotin--[biotin carboxyl-carrier protein] ligase n=1 Tax=Agrilactobacillus composti DSM 18527 = JCM 14202 TaxID=1423734 RepID=X0PNQ2_9LACO|nr:biotin--[acetyl-CoA-carboxylase] ligase [Agrilactobacillus composti]KRM32875.1 biotin operon repressor [Agrilactobacillus composti DSM 18527 = JCM 14202]GAF39222.1 biotin-protein ligase [Agrilactobacillus composti DSM 18527 = JCM 14202]